MDDNTRLVLITVAVAAIVALILWLGLPQNPADYEGMANNTTGPPPAYTFKPPLWIVPVAGVIAGIIGLVAGVGQTHD